MTGYYQHLQLDENDSNVPEYIRLTPEYREFQPQLQNITDFAPVCPCFRFHFNRTGGVDLAHRWVGLTGWGSNDRNYAYCS